ncbi:MAG: bifunctional anthranilate synthase component I family protein/class IV aminotransferase [Solirubrobacteraceae bacterium]|nr:bifunctional anthranilate synthase component I family protein/class IV aminotransferase [Patulibacter sp.]
MTVAGPPARVRLVRGPLGAEPSVDDVLRAVDGLAFPFVLQGRWGLPAGAPPESRVVVAGAVPGRVAPAVDAAEGDDPFAILDDRPALVGESPPGAIGGGWFGWLGYDLGRDVERTLGPQPRRPAPLARRQLAWYDDVLRRDEHGVWWVEALLGAGDATGETLDDAVARWHGRLAVGSAVARGAEGGARVRGATGPLGPMRIDRGGAAHRAAVAETVERIAAGELFQANVCLRLEGAVRAGGGAELAASVFRDTDPWFGAWIGGVADTAIVSASPELFLRRRGRTVTTGPIKGTAPRTAGVGVDADEAAAALLRSEKDRAEHVMIVDLMRNDLGRVCDYGSVDYGDEPRLEPHAGVWHLVSDVGGRLHDGLGDARLLRATFPPGSVTGAPKVQAMRVIAAVEGTGREVYTGAHGFVSPAAGVELAVTIRTLELAGEQAWVGVGGGIVADSDPGAELAEALTKARALLSAAGSHIADTADDPVPAPTPTPWITSFDARPDPAAGLVETLHVTGGAAEHVAAHLARLAGSAAALGLGTLPVDLAERIAGLAATADGTARLRVVLGPTPTGTARTGNLRLGKPALHEPAPGAEVELQLIPVAIDPTVPIELAPVVLPGGLGPHKWLDRALVDHLTTRLGATPLLLDADGTVLEAGWANVWWLDGDTLCTPPTDWRILPGVTRDILLGATSVNVRTATFDAIATSPLLLTSARGVSIGRLAETPPSALDAARRAAERLAPLVRDHAS